MLVGTAVATCITTTTLAEWTPNPIYPDPAFKVLDPSFLKYRPTVVGVERLATGMTWGEGPVWFGDGRYLIWSDIPNNRMMRWDEATGAVGVFRSPSNKRTGTRATAKAASSRASTAPAVSPVQRRDHGPGRSVRGQAAQFAKRRSGEIRRFDLVHRPALRHFQQLPWQRC
jgi:gluconolactonase